MIPREYKEDGERITPEQPQTTTSSEPVVIQAVSGRPGQPTAVVVEQNGVISAGASTDFGPSVQAQADQYVQQHIDEQPADSQAAIAASQPAPVFNSSAPRVKVDIPQGGDFAATRNELLKYENGTRVQLGDSSNEDVYVYNGGLVNSRGEYYTGYGGVTSGMAAASRQTPPPDSGQDYSGPWSKSGDTTVRKLITTPSKADDSSNERLVAAGVFGTPEKVNISGREYTDHLGGKRLIDFGNDIIDKIDFTTKQNIAINANNPGYKFGASATDAILKGVVGGIPLTIGTGLLMGQQAVEDYISGNVGTYRYNGVTPIVYPKGTVDTWTKMFTGETVSKNSDPVTREYDEIVTAQGGEKIKQTTYVYDENNKLVDTIIEDAYAKKGDQLTTHTKETSYTQETTRTPGIPEIIGGELAGFGSGIAADPVAGLGMAAGTGLLLFGPGKIRGVRGRAGVSESVESSIIKVADKPVEEFTVKPSNNEGAYYHVVNTETGAKLPGQLSDIPNVKGTSTNDLLYQRTKLQVYDISKTTKETDIGFMKATDPVVRVTTKDFTEPQFGNVFEGSGKGLPKELNRKIDVAPKTSDEQFIDTGNPFDKERLGVKAVVSTDDAALSIKGLQRSYTDKNYLAGGVADLMFKRTSKGNLDLLNPRSEFELPLSKGMLSGLLKVNTKTDYKTNTYGTSTSIGQQKKGRRFREVIPSFTGLIPGVKISGDLSINTKSKDYIDTVIGQTQVQGQTQKTRQQTSTSQINSLLNGTRQTTKQTTRKAGVFMPGIPGSGGGSKKLFGSGMSLQKYVTGDVTGLIYGKKKRKTKRR